MPDNDFAEALAVLGLQAGDGLKAVCRTYDELKELYAEDSLATYTLLDEEERRILLERIEQAYRRITQGAPAAAKSPVGEPSHTQGADPGTEECSRVPDWDGEGRPGLQLKQARERIGMSLREIADRTKIGTRRLQHIEDERFDQLPAAVFLRGFVTQFAEAVGIADPEAAAHSYLEKVRESV